MAKKIINVTCAIIEKENKVLIAQRSEKMSDPLKWEFPGGKIEPDETYENCIKREILEELGILIDVVYSLNESVHEDESRVITLFPFICKTLSGSINLSEHIQIKWEKPESLYNYDLSSSDIPVLTNYINYKNNEN